MAHSTSEPTMAPDTLTDRRVTTPASTPSVVLPNLDAPNPHPPGWDRAWRSCWPLVVGVVLVTAGVLGLLLEAGQPRVYERVVLLRVQSPDETRSAQLTTQLADLRKLAEQPSRWDGSADGLPAPHAPGLTIQEASEPGDLVLNLRGDQPGALEGQLRTVLALHREAILAREESLAEQRMEQCKKGMARIEEQLKALPPVLPVRTNESSLQTARDVLEQAQQRRLAVQNELAQARKPRQPEIRPLSPEILEKMLRSDPNGAQLLEARRQKVHEMETVKRVAVGVTRENSLRKLEKSLAEIDLLLTSVQVRLTQPYVEQEKIRWEGNLRDLLAKLNAELATASALEAAARTHYEAVQAIPMVSDSSANEERLRLEEAHRKLQEVVRDLETREHSAVGFEVRSEQTHQANVWIRYATTFGASLMMGLLLGGVVVARQKSYGRVRSAAELAETTGLPVLGRMGMVSGNAVPIPGVRPGGAPGREVQLLEAAADQVRGPVLRQFNTGPVQLLVTSPGNRDGRTTVASQLACSLARAGKRVLLVDAAPVHSDLAWLFQLNPEPGLAEVLRGELELGNVVQATSFSRLWLLPAGHVDNQALAALSQDWANHLFEPILGQVDFIVIDGPPMDRVAEVSAWASRVQAALVVARSGHTPLKSVHAACQQLHLLRLPILGQVLLEATAANENADEPSA